MINWTHVVIHHSLTKDSGTVSWGAIRKYHNGLGWNGIGYHFGVELIDDFYEVLFGRSLMEKGAHCKDVEMNDKAVGICVIGNYDIAPPPFALLIPVVRLIRTIMAIYKIPRQNVIGHREVGMMIGLDWQKGEYKTCPGKLFNMDNFRNAV